MPIDVARSENGLSSALSNQSRPDVTLSSDHLRNIGNAFLTAERIGAAIDVPEGARQVKLVISDTLANVVGMSLIELAKRLEDVQADPTCPHCHVKLEHPPNACSAVNVSPPAKIEVLQ